MDNIYNVQEDKWIRPWNIKKFDELTYRDERFFSILIKGCLNWLNHHIFMYDDQINHFILNNENIPDLGFILFKTGKNMNSKTKKLLKLVKMKYEISIFLS